MVLKVKEMKRYFLVEMFHGFIFFKLCVWQHCIVADVGAITCVVASEPDGISFVDGFPSDEFRV